MIRLLKWLIGLMLLVSILPLVALLAAFQTEPLVSSSHRLTQENVHRIKGVLRDANPRWLRVGDTRELSLIETDFNLILNYGMTQVAPGAVEVQLRPAVAEVKLSLAGGSIFKGRFFNTRFAVIQTDRGFVPGSWRLGNLPIPDWLTAALARTGHSLLMEWGQYRVALEALEELELDAEEIRVKYHWQQELKEQLRNTSRQVLFSEEDQERLAFYHERIYLLSRELPRRTSLTPMLAALFDSAARNSSTPDEAVAENRAALLALGFHVARIDLNHFLLEPARNLNYFWLLRPTLVNRQDLAQHFVISAGIAASAGQGIATAAGLFKELKDSQGGSGFSFPDLAADRAGTRLAEMALHPESAYRVQRMLREAKEEHIYMPDISSLPEGLQELEFTARYDNLDNEAFMVMHREIEKRIARCELFARSP